MKSHDDLLILSTATGERKSFRTRIKNIGRRSHTFWSLIAIVLLMAGLACLAACDVLTASMTEALNGPVKGMETVAETPKSKPIPSDDSRSNYWAATLQAWLELIPTPSDTSRSTQGDFDSDGQMDIVTVTDYYDTRDEVDPHVLITVTLGTGETLSYRIDGFWMAYTPQTGDFDGDGKADVLLFLEYWGSNYGAGSVRVLCVEEGELMEFPYAIYPNEALLYDQGFMDSVDTMVCIGASVLNRGGEDLLRLQYPIDVKEYMTAWYIDLQWTQNGFAVADMAVGEAYGNALLPQATPSPAQTTIPTAHRDGFQEAEIIFCNDGSNMLQPAINPDKVYVSANGTILPTIREVAQEALRQLYDMTGVLIETCYAAGSWDDLLFSVDGKDFNHASFFSYSYTVSGIYILNIAYAQPRVEYSPIDPAQVVKPEGFADMTLAERAQWYYENSGYGDRRAVVRAEEGPFMDMARLYLEDDGFYEVYFDTASGLPCAFYGPYSAGFEH